MHTTTQLSTSSSLNQLDDHSTSCDARKDHTRPLDKPSKQRTATRKAAASVSASDGSVAADEAKRARMECESRNREGRWSPKSSKAGTLRRNFTRYAVAPPEKLRS